MKSNWSSTHKQIYPKLDMWEISEDSVGILLDNKYKIMPLLKSERFWGVVVASAGFVLTSPDFLVDAWYVSLGKFLAFVATGATAVGTSDRVGSQVK